MPIYTVGGKKYNIPDDKSQDFEKDFPNASVQMDDGRGKSYNIPLSKRSDFQSDFSDWEYSAVDDAKEKNKSLTQGANMVFSADDIREEEESSPVGTNIVRHESKKRATQKHQQGGWKAPEADKLKWDIINDNLQAQNSQNNLQPQNGPRIKNIVEQTLNQKNSGNLYQRATSAPRLSNLLGTPATKADLSEVKDKSGKETYIKMRRGGKDIDIPLSQVEEHGGIEAFAKDLGGAH